MSMSGNYCKITIEQFTLLVKKKISVSDFLYSDKGYITDEDKLDIDKSWDCINFILTEKSMMNMGENLMDMNNLPPIFNVVMGGKEISDEDIGYGSARYLTNEEVKDCYQIIKDITEEEFKNKFSIQEMIENMVYSLMDDENEDEFFEYIFYHFKALQSFFEKASLEDKYMLLYIN